MVPCLAEYATGRPGPGAPAAACVVAAVDVVGRLGEYAPRDLAQLCMRLVHPKAHMARGDFRLLWAAAVEAMCRIAPGLPAPPPPPTPTPTPTAAAAEAGDDDVEGGTYIAAAASVSVSTEDARVHAESAELLAPLVSMLTDPLPHARGGAARVLTRAPPSLTAAHLPALVALAEDPVPWQGEYITITHPMLNLLLLLRGSV